MDEEARSQEPEARSQKDELREIVRTVMEEFAGVTKLQQQVNELVAAAEQADQSTTIRAELQKAGVAKIDLAYRAVKDDIYRSEDGRLLARGGSDLRDYVAQFLGENPELLPARLAGGSGASAGQRTGTETGSFDLSRIRPGMSAEEMERARQEVARVALQTLRGI